MVPPRPRNIPTPLRSSLKVPVVAGAWPSAGADRKAPAARASDEVDKNSRRFHFMIMATLRSPLSPLLRHPNRGSDPGRVTRLLQTFSEHEPLCSIPQLAGVLGSARPEVPVEAASKCS